MAHASRPIPARRLFAEGEYMGAYLGHPNDPRNDPDAGWRECLDCDGDGCDMCDQAGGFLGDQPMSWEEHERLMEQ